MAQTGHDPVEDDLRGSGENEVEDQKSEEVPQPPVAMWIVGELRGLRATELPRPIDDILDTQQEKKRRGLDQNHPQV